MVYRRRSRSRRSRSRRSRRRSRRGGKVRKRSRAPTLSAAQLAHIRGRDSRVTTQAGIVRAANEKQERARIISRLQRLNARTDFPSINFSESDDLVTLRKLNKVATRHGQSSGISRSRVPWSRPSGSRPVAFSRTKQRKMRKPGAAGLAQMNARAKARAEKMAADRVKRAKAQALRVKRALAAAKNRPRVPKRSRPSLNYASLNFGQINALRAKLRRDREREVAAIRKAEKTQQELMRMWTLAVAHGGFGAPDASGKLGPNAAGAVPGLGYGTMDAFLPLFQKVNPNRSRLSRNSRDSWD